ncbi:MAG TPA: YggS family pyridoxal phosphate-dependent enzyme [Pyrinomonadaceae bacterium]|nr:YggS family pyridoxal phosphate-dependent enzyme [Pyrinomonadaceae bacterium]
MTGSQTSAAEFARRVQCVRNDINACGLRCNRAPSDITLVAVSKTHPPDAIHEGISLGLTDFGENRVQEAESKIPIVGRDAARWHLIGHLQSNKARKAVELFDVIHSLDSIVLAQRLDRICVESNREKLPVLIQVDLGHEERKTGVGEKNLSELVSTVAESERLQLRGLMTLPPFFDEAEKARLFFRRLRELRDDLQAQGAFGNRRGDLSMGMTHDYQVAIEEGATIVRIGTAIFGERNQLKTEN